MNKFITFSFDDGVLQDLRIIKILNKYNLRATFNLNSGRFGISFPLLYNGVIIERKVILPDMIHEYDGHEIAVHTLNHAKLSNLSEEDIAREINVDAENLEKLVGYKVEGMAYPWSEFDDRVLNVIKTKTFIKYARTIVPLLNLKPCSDLLLFKPTCRYGSKEMYKLADELINSTSNEPMLLYIWGHCYEFDYEPGKYEKFEEFCKYISNKKDIEYCTNIEVFKKLNLIK